MPPYHVKVFTSGGENPNWGKATKGFISLIILLCLYDLVGDLPKRRGEQNSNMVAIQSSINNHCNHWATCVSLAYQPSSGQTIVGDSHSIDGCNPRSGFTGGDGLPTEYERHPLWYISRKDILTKASKLWQKASTTNLEGEIRIRFRGVEAQRDGNSEAISVARSFDAPRGGPPPLPTPSQLLTPSMAVLSSRMRMSMLMAAANRDPSLYVKWA